MVWYTSDTHYGHRNIVKGESQWEDTSECRDFNTVEHMNRALIDAINKYVKPGDTLYHMGDWSFGGIDNIYNFRKALICNDIRLIEGNHDHHIHRNKAFGKVRWDGKRMVESENEALERVRTRELFTKVAPMMEIKVNGQRIILCHYALRVWNKSHHGSWQLHGHSHASLPLMNQQGDVRGPNNYFVPLARQMDVGVDVAYLLTGEYRPFSHDEIVAIMSHRDPLLVDHHNENTN